MRFNDFFKQRRMALGTVREFAKQSGLDAAYVSRLENGVALPPKDFKKLEKIGVALRLERGSEEWRTFLDLAAVAKNELPEDLQDDERVATILPAFYRTLRNEKFDEGEVKELLEMIKSAGEEE